MLKNIERAKTLLAAAKAAAEDASRKQALGITMASPIAAATHVLVSGGFTWNTEQSTAIDYTEFRKSFCLIGAAGTRKTTTLKGALLNALAKHRVPPLEAGTEHLSGGAPGVAIRELLFRPEWT
ncbi:hypothetical protein [Massilia antarctica]|uniref:hypothetical protein n=1 Tax=Massilia antarctica TaxID=2765360 RepID=UPI00226EEB3C|nr:hypothetical protein [Massilia sp. H27-R4]MCY0916314.1 hypothetical protein [Massilia sp. H27-R4]